MAGKIKPINVAKGCAGCYLTLLLLIAILGIAAFCEDSADAGWGGIILSLLGFIFFLLFYGLFLFGKSLVQNKKTKIENQVPQAQQSVVVVAHEKIELKSKDDANMAKRTPEKVTSFGEIVKTCFALIVLFLLVFGAIFTFIVPPVGIAVFILGFCLLLVFGKIYGQNEEPKKENPVSQAQRVNDIAQQIVDVLFLPRPARCRPPNGKLPPDIKSKIKSSGISVEQVIDAVERKIEEAKVQVARPVIERQKNQVPREQRVTVDLAKSLDNVDSEGVFGFEKRADAVISRIQKQAEELKFQIQEHHEWIEITWISGDKKITCIGKEGWQCREAWNCHCWRLNSNNNIIKVRKYMNADYPFYLIDTHGARHSQHEFFEEVSFDRQTNTEKTETKKLLSWRLFDRQEFNKWLDATRVYEDDAMTEKQWIEEIAAKKRRETD